MQNLNNSSDIFDFANSIMTTDTFLKYIQKNTDWWINNNFDGCCKGSEWYIPIWLQCSFILTDANISKSALCTSLKESVSKTYNMISVDRIQAPTILQ